MVMSHSNHFNKVFGGFCADRKEIFMEMKCVQGRKELPNMEEFKKAVQPLIEWRNANCDPHEKVVVEMGKAMLVSEEMGFTFEVSD